MLDVCLYANIYIYKFAQILSISAGWADFKTSNSYHCMKESRKNGKEEKMFSSLWCPPLPHMVPGESEKQRVCYP